MPFLIDKATGKPVFVADQDVQARLEAGEVEYAEGAQILQTDVFGDEVVASPEQTGELQYLPDDPGLQPADLATVSEYEKELDYGDRPVSAFLLGAGRSLTLGGTDIAAEALGYGYDVDQIAERNVGASTTGEVGGAIGALFIPGGQYTAAGALSRSALAFSRAGVGASRLAQASRAAIAAGAEGYAYGTGLSLGESVRRGEDLSAAAAQALQDGAMGAAYSAAAGGVLELGAQAFQRVREPLTRQRVARGVMDDVTYQVDDVRVAMKDVTKAEAKVAASETAVREAEERLVQLQREGATIDDLISARGELDELRLARSQARTASGTVAKRKAQQKFAEAAEAGRVELADSLPMTVLVTRGSVDRIRSFATKASRGGFKNPEVAAAFSQVDEALERFDDMFIESIKPSASGGRLTKYKIGVDKTTRAPTKLENAGVLKDVKAAFLKDPDGARKVIEDLDNAGGRLAQLVKAEDNPFLNWVPEDAVRGTDIWGYADDAYMTIDDVAKRVAELSEASTVQKADELIEGAKEQFRASAEDVARAERRVRDLEGNLRARGKQEATLDKAKQRLRSNREALEERRALLENAEQGKAWADELEQLAIEAGALPKEGFTKADMAMAAVDLGIDGSSDAEWAVRLHLLTKFFGGGKGVRGALGRVASKGVDIGTGLASAVARRAPGGAVLAEAVSAAGRKASAGLKGAAKQQPKTVVRVGEARRLFETRLDKAVKSIRRKSKVPRTVGVVAPHTTLAKATFADIDHGKDFAGLDKDTAEFEKRAAELEAVVAGGGDVRGFAEKQVGKNVAGDADVLAGVSAGAERGLAYLHSKLPPRRYVGGNALRRNASQAEIRKFARTVRYVLDPGALADDIATRRVSMEGPEAVRAVYPSLFSRMQLEFLTAFTEDEKGEKYDRATRTYIGRVLDLPQLNSSLRPSYIGMLQGASGPQQPTQPPPRRTLKLSSNAPTESGRQLEA